MILTLMTLSLRFRISYGKAEIIKVFTYFLFNPTFTNKFSFFWFQFLNISRQDRNTEGHRALGRDKVSKYVLHLFSS
jgi:hypothetical protein